MNETVGLLILIMLAQSCSICDHTFSETTNYFRTYFKHLAKHRNMHNMTLTCPDLNCPNIYKSYQGLYNHFKRCHIAFRRTFIAENFERTGYGNELVFICKLDSCQLTFTDMKILIKHTYSHLRSNTGSDTEITCPYQNCTRAYINILSLRSHISRCHKQIVEKSSLAYTAHSSVGTDIIELQESAICDHRQDDDAGTATGTTSHALNNISISDVSFLSESVHDCFVNPFAMFCLKLEACHLVPRSIIQSVFDEIKILSENADSNLKDRLAHTLHLSETQSNDLNDVFDTQSFSAILQNECNGLSTTYRRNQYYQKNFGCIVPVAVLLGEIDGTKYFYHYISIKEQLKTFFKNVHFLSCSHSFTEGVMVDFWDGSLYKHLRGSSSVNIFLYQDAFEICNPLGSSKKKHKIVGVYCMLGNLPAHQRSKLDNIFLIMLVKETYLKKFGQTVVFRRLISELSSLCTHGFSVDGEHFHPFNLLGILGDNLGSHYVGGFTENFNVENFCRFCLISKTQFKVEPYAISELRSQENYDCSITVLQHNPALNNHAGIKFNSVFNQIPRFHVCNPALPPCIGHDIFEGVIAYDMVLFIKYFVFKKWFSFEVMNHRILNFSYSYQDANDRPPTFTSTACKLNGQAAENWCFFRLFPLIMFGLIKDPNDKVWKLYLSLKEAVELICSCKISHQQISYLDILLKDYVDRRQKHFPSNPLKPKHHYCVHYAQLTRKFGPLLRLWTMRMESKHSYFKNVAATAKCFKNITQTLAEKHQLFQAYRCSDSYTNVHIKLSSPRLLNISAFSPSMKSEIEQRNLLGDIVTAPSAEYLGTIYRCSMIVFMKSLQSSDIHFCQIKNILKNENNLYFILAKCDACFLSEYGIYHLTVCENDIMCKHVTEISHFYPLPVYDINGSSYVSLKHAVLRLDC